MTDASGRAGSSGYDSAAVLGAMLATLFFPVVALIAALLLQGNESDPVKRGQLRTWAWISAGWLVAQALLAVFMFVAIASLHPMP